MHTKDLTRYVQAVIQDGKSVNSQAKLAGVDPTELRRLVVAHSDYSKAKAEGKIRSRPTYKAEDLLNSEPVKAVLGGANVVDVASRYGLYEGTLRNHVKKARAALNEDSAMAPAIANGNVEPGPSLTRSLPLISWVKASSWDEAVDPFQPGDAEAWYWCPRPCSTSSYVLRVRGDSMTAPTGNRVSYPQDSLVFVDPEKRSPNTGDRIIAKLSGSTEVTFKVYKNEDGRQWLAPLNPMHPPIYDEFKVLGTVIGGWVD